RFGKVSTYAIVLVKVKYHSFINMANREEAKPPVFTCLKRNPFGTHQNIRYNVFMRKHYTFRSSCSPRCVNYSGKVVFGNSIFNILNLLLVTVVLTKFQYFVPAFAPRYVVKGINLF